MANTLKIDDNFSPCPVQDGDELFRNGIFEFNVTKIIEYIQENPGLIGIEEVSVDDFFTEFTSLTEDHIDSVDISKPVILAEISPGRFNLIDGNHRMEKARRVGIEKLKSYRLSVDHHVGFLTSKRAYLAYVEYWNSKLIE